MSAIKQREKYSVICHGNVTNYWMTDNEDEANTIYESMSNFIGNPYRKIEICEWKFGNYVTINEITAFPKKR